MPDTMRATDPYAGRESKVAGLAVNALVRLVPRQATKPSCGLADSGIVDVVLDGHVLDAHAVHPVPLEALLIKDDALAHQKPQPYLASRLIMLASSLFCQEGLGVINQATVNKD